MDRDEKRYVEGGDLSKALGAVSEALSRRQGGAIRLTVHDGTVMQFELTETKRLAC